MYKETSIGQLLSYIIKDLPQEDINNNIIHPDNRKRYLELKERYDELGEKPELLKNIFSSVPKETCLSHNPFLQNNIDFFIAFSLLSNNNEIDAGNTSNFIQHLNNCYWCFSAYNNFIKDLYYTNKELEKITGA